MNMVDKVIYPKLAENAMDSLGVKDGDVVFISGGAHQQEFLEELAIHVARRGGQPFIHAVSDEYRKRYLHTATTGQLKREPGIMKAIAESMDAYIKVEPYADPTIRSVMRDKVRSYSEGMQVFFDTMHSGHKRSLYIGWATEGMARMYGVSLETLERLVIGGATVDYKKVHEDCMHIKGLLENARYVHASDPHGTDLRLMIEGRRINLSDAIFTHEKAAMGQLGGNLPTGEVFIATVETYGSGRLFCPLTIDGLTRGTIIKGATLEFRDGLLIPDKCTADTNADVLVDSINALAEMDIKKYGAPNALKVAELGIGLNPVIDRAIGYILTDEKIGGSVHVAFGRNEMYGGRTKSHMHWDFVTAPDITLEVEYRDGSRISIIDGGKLL